MSLSRSNVQKAGDHAVLISREVAAASISGPQCVAFWYYMFEPIVDNTGPNLGKLSVWIKEIDK